MKKVDQQTLRKILKLIQKHVGKSNPIQVDELISNTGLTDREIRKAVQSLVNDEGYPIGSTTRGPFGFYRIANEDDFLEAINNLSGRDKEIVKRIMKLFENCKNNGVKIKKFKNKVVNGNTTINIKNIFVINLSNE